MRNILATLLASAAVIAFASQASAMGGCDFGHTKQVMASTVDEEAATISTHDGTVKLPDATDEAEEASVVPLPSDDDRANLE